MGIRTRVYEIDGDLAINIPQRVLPPRKLQWVEIEETIPGHPAAIDWYPCIVRPYKTRTAVLLTHDIAIPGIEAMSRLGFDSSKKIEVRPYGYDIWIPAHLYHGRYVRAWIPKYVARRTGIRGHTIWPFFIRGTTLPEKRIRYVEREVREVTINHMDKKYPTENYATNRWRWRIPKQLECYPVLAKAISINIYPEAQCHLSGEIIYIDFIFSKPAGMILSEQMRYAYRSSAVRNYTATEDVDYPLLIEIRCLYYSSTPKSFYQTEERHIPLKQALEITVYNMLQYFFNPAKEGQLYSAASYAEHIGKIDYTTTRLNLRKHYPKIEDAPPIIAPGEIEQETTPETKINFYSAIKYVRVLNEQAYKRGNPEMYVYTDADITAILLQKIENRMLQGLPPLYELDENGFLWRLKV